MSRCDKYRRAERVQSDDATTESADRWTRIVLSRRDKTYLGVNSQNLQIAEAKPVPKSTSPVTATIMALRRAALRLLGLIRRGLFLRLITTRVAHFRSPSVHLPQRIAQRLNFTLVRILLHLGQLQRLQHFLHRIEHLLQIRDNPIHFINGFRDGSGRSGLKITPFLPRRCRQRLALIAILRFFVSLARIIMVVLRFGHCLFRPFAPCFFDGRICHRRIGGKRLGKDFFRGRVFRCCEHFVRFNFAGHRRLFSRDFGRCRLASAPASPATTA